MAADTGVQVTDKWFARVDVELALKELLEGLFVPGEWVSWARRRVARSSYRVIRELVSLVPKMRLEGCWLDI